MTRYSTFITRYSLFITRFSLFYNSILAFYYSILDFYNSILDFYNSILDFYNSILDFYNSELTFFNSKLDTVKKEFLSDKDVKWLNAFASQCARGKSAVARKQEFHPKKFNGKIVFKNVTFQILFFFLVN